MVFQGPYNTFTPFRSNQLGGWRFTVTNKQGQIAVQDSHNLDKPVQMLLPQNIRVENISTTNSNPVQVMFNAVPGTNFYVLEIYNENLIGQVQFFSDSFQLRFPRNNYDVL